MEGDEEQWEVYMCIYRERKRKTRRVDHHWSKRTPKNLSDQGKLSLLD